MRIDINRVKLVKEASVNYSKDFVITSPSKIKEFLDDIHDLSNEVVENFVVIAMNNKNKVITSVLSRGTCNTALVDTRDLFQWLLLNNAVSFAVAHNHPSGDCYPSTDDKQLTDRIKQASKIMGIRFLDHVIVGEYSYNSFNEMGLI